MTCMCPFSIYEDITKDELIISCLYLSQIIYDFIVMEWMSNEVFRNNQITAKIYFEHKAQIAKWFNEYISICFGLLWAFLKRTSLKRWDDIDSHINFATRL